MSWNLKEPARFYLIDPRLDFQIPTCLKHSIQSVPFSLTFFPHAIKLIILEFLIQPRKLEISVHYTQKVVNLVRPLIYVYFISHCIHSGTSNITQLVQRKWQKLSYIYKELELPSIL